MNKCKNCDEKLLKGGEICEKCEEATTEMEHIKSSISNVGASLVGIGGLSIFANLVIFILGFYNVIDAYPSLMGVVLVSGLSLLFIILGNRVRSIYDENINRYILILIIATAAYALFSFSYGGGIGIFVFIYLISAFSIVSKHLKNEKYRELLITPKHKIQKWMWIPLILLFGLSIHLGREFDINRMYSNIDQETIEEIVDSMRRGVSLPFEIDENTTLVSISAKSGRIAYMYILSGFEEEEVSQQELELFVNENFCNDRDFLRLLNGGVNFEYKYKLQGKDVEYTILLTEKDCW